MIDEAEISPETSQSLKLRSVLEQVKLELLSDLFYVCLFVFLGWVLFKHITEIIIYFLSDNVSI